MSITWSRMDVNAVQGLYIPNVPSMGYVFYRDDQDDDEYHVVCTFVPKGDGVEVRMYEANTPPSCYLCLGSGEERYQIPPTFNDWPIYDETFRRFPLDTSILIRKCIRCVGVGLERWTWREIMEDENDGR